MKKVYKLEEMHGRVERTSFLNYYKNLKKKKLKRKIIKTLNEIKGYEKNFMKFHGNFKEKFGEILRLPEKYFRKLRGKFVSCLQKLRKND